MNINKTHIDGKDTYTAKVGNNTCTVTVKGGKVISFTYKYKNDTYWIKLDNDINAVNINIFCAEELLFLMQVIQLIGADPDDNINLDYEIQLENGLFIFRTDES